MIDFHNHILPNIDDGAKDIEMAIDMLKNAFMQMIKNLAHYMLKI